MTNFLEYTAQSKFLAFVKDVWSIRGGRAQDCGTHTSGQNMEIWRG